MPGCWPGAEHGCRSPSGGIAEEHRRDYDFFIDNINKLFGTGFVLKNIVLPLGISFFTFQQLSFLLSIYKKEEKVEALCDYCLFVSFFPQLVAGPIVLYSEMIPQFKDESRRHFRSDNFAAGIYIFAIGLFTLNQYGL